jgi:hypothetical protein
MRKGVGCMKKKKVFEEIKVDDHTTESPDSKATQTCDDKKTIHKDLYLDIIKALFKKYRNRIETYYCTNLTCKKTFWSAQEGYMCSQCGSFGMISEFKSYKSSTADRNRHILGYLDNIGRLVCTRCMQNYDVNDDVSFIVYDDTQPYCLQACDICRQDLNNM